MTHFFAPDGEYTLCRAWRVHGVLYRSNPVADCPACVAAHQRAGWTFPLPELAITL